MAAAGSVASSGGRRGRGRGGGGRSGRGGRGGGRHGGSGGIAKRGRGPPEKRLGKPHKGKKVGEPAEEARRDGRPGGDDDDGDDANAQQTEGSAPEAQKAHQLALDSKERKRALKALNKTQKSHQGGRMKAAEYKALKEQSEGIASAEPGDQADWLWQHFSMATGASSLEKEGLSGSCMKRMDGSLLGAMKTAAVGLRPTSSERGAPAVLVVAASAVTANNIVKKLRDPVFGKVAKLFAKHIKVEDQKQQLEESQLLMGVGTPNRLHKLAEIGAMKMDALQLLIVDVQRDAKLMTLLDISDTRTDFFRLFKEHCLPRLASGSGLQLCLINAAEL